MTHTTSATAARSLSQPSGGVKMQADASPSEKLKAQHDAFKLFAASLDDFMNVKSGSEALDKQRFKDSTENHLAAMGFPRARGSAFGRKIGELVVSCFMETLKKLLTARDDVVPHWSEKVKQLELEVIDSNFDPDIAAQYDDAVRANNVAYGEYFRLLAITEQLRDLMLRFAPISHEVAAENHRKNRNGLPPLPLKDGRL